MRTEILEGSAYREGLHEDSSDEWDLLVVYEEKRWSESHGDAIGREHFRATEPMEYMLNNKHITLEELRGELGADLASKMIYEAMDL